MSHPDVSSDQYRTCRRFSVECVPSPPYLKVGIARDVRHGLWPLHGLRHPVVGDTTGWYIWSGQWSDAADFFVPLHVEHLAQWRPEVLPYLALPPGWRFLLAPNYEDVWEDPTLLDDI